MKQNENKQNRYKSPILAGYSDRRMHFMMFLGLVVIVLGGPQYLLVNSITVLVFELFVAAGAATFQRFSYRSELLFRKMMDEFYNNGKNAELFNKELTKYKSLSQIIVIRSTKKIRRLKQKLLTQYQNSTIPRKIASMKMAKHTNKVTA